MYLAEKTSGDEFIELIDKEHYCAVIGKCLSRGFEVGGKCVGGIVLNENKLHLSVLPEYQGKWGHLFTPAFKWAFSVSDPLYAIVSRDNEQVLRFIRRHDWKQIHEKDSTVIFELTDNTTRYPK